MGGCALAHPRTDLRARPRGGFGVELLTDSYCLLAPRALSGLVHRRPIESLPHAAHTPAGMPSLIGEWGLALHG